MAPAALQNSLTVAPLARAPAPAGPRAWAVGQILSATVVSAGDGAAASLLRVAGETLQAQARLPLEAGQALRLQVTDAGPPAVLKVIDPGSADDVATQATQLLRATLPRQRPLGESLATLQRVSEQPFSRRAGDLPDAARALLSDLLASLPRPRDARDGARLAAMVRASGLFHEAEMARAESRSTAQAASGGNGHAVGGADFKARVAAVADALRHAVQAGGRDGPTREADTALRAVLARIETNQALSARGSVEQGGSWRTDLPFADERGPQSVALSIRREDARDRARLGATDGDATDWVVDLHIQPPGASPLHARVSLSAGVVNTLFTSEDSETLSRLQAHGDELARRLEGEALSVGGVRWRRDTPPSQVSLAGVAGLVDERV